MACIGDSGEILMIESCRRGVLNTVDVVLLSQSCLCLLGVDEKSDQ